MDKFWLSVWLVGLLAVSTTHARIIGKAGEDKVCPFNSSGDYPNCVCESGSQFNPIHNVCPPKSLESFAGSCPDNSTGVYPNCVCKYGKVYDHLNSVCFELDRTKCPHRSVGTVPNCKCEEGYKLDDIYWYCRPWYLNDTRGDSGNGAIPQCPVFHLWDGSKCEPIRCPNDRTLLYPHCTTENYTRAPVSCPPGQDYTIERPYCHCPNEQEYTFPICHERCTTGTYFDMKTKSCAKRPCPAGWLGDFYPHCTVASFQRCSEEFPGIWPNCNIYDQGSRLEERKNRFNFIKKIEIF